MLGPPVDACPAILEQVACIREAYENKYGRSLAKTIQKKFHGKMEDGLLSLLFDPIENFARGLKAAFHGMGTDQVGEVKGCAASTTGQSFRICEKISHTRPTILRFACSRFACTSTSLERS